MTSGAAAKDWIIYSSASFALFMAGLFFPFFTLPLMLIYPFPMILLTFEHGAALGFFSSLFISFLLLLILPPIFSIVYFFTLGLSGVLLGVAARRTKGGETVFLGVVFAILCAITAAFMSAWITGENLLSPDPVKMEEALLAFWGPRLSSLPEESAVFRANLPRAVDYFVTYIPCGLIIFSSAEVLSSYSIASYIHARRFKEKFFSLPPFSSWAFPKNVLLALAAGVIFQIAAGDNADMLLLRRAGANLNAVARVIFAIQGLSVACFFMENRGFPKFARVVMIVLVPIVTVLENIFAIVGIVDIGFDLRKRARRK
jgi:uncharacterized protein YybS (DUF2232 family)